MESLCCPTGTSIPTFLNPGVGYRDIEKLKNAEIAIRHFRMRLNQSAGFLTSVRTSDRDLEIPATDVAASEISAATKVSATTGIPAVEPAAAAGASVVGPVVVT